MSHILATLRQYVSPSGTDSAAKSRDMIRLAALGVTVGYTVALAYRAGALKYVMPARCYNALVSGVEKVKEGTQPLVNKERFALCSSHLLRTYGLLSAGCVLSAVGTRVFFAYPNIPIGIPIAVSATSAAMLVLARKYMTVPGRLFAYGVMCLATGVSFGPLNWIALDSVVPFAIVASSTAVGFCAPLYLTRGFASYFCSSQLLSCSLSIVGCGLIVSSVRTDRGVSPAARARLAKDVSTMIAAQVVVNVAVAALHTFPTIYRFVNSPLKALEEEDSIHQASLIYGGFAYAVWSFFRIVSNRVFRAFRGKKSAANRAAREGMVADVAAEMGRMAGDTSKSSTLFTLRNMSDLSASVMFLFTYTRFVTYLQNNPQGSEKLFNICRRVFALFSPV